MSIWEKIENLEERIENLKNEIEMMRAYGASFEELADYQCELEILKDELNFAYQDAEEELPLHFDYNYSEFEY